MNTSSESRISFQIHLSKDKEIKKSSGSRNRLNLQNKTPKVTPRACNAALFLVTCGCICTKISPVSGRLKPFGER